MEGNQPQTNFDEKPIALSTTNQFLDEYPPDFDPNQIAVEVEKKPDPLDKRLKSKVLKIRKQALDQLLQQVREDPRVFEEHSKLTTALLSDANLTCQERALKIIQQYMLKRNKFPVQDKDLIRTIFEKCLINQKQEIIAPSYQILFWAMDFGSQETLMATIKEEIMNKNPKICGVTVNFLTALLNNYGTKKLKGLEQFAKCLDLYGSTGRGQAKSSCLSLYKELYRWIGEQVFNDFTMHHEVRDELRKFVKTYQKETMKPKRGAKVKKNNLDETEGQNECDNNDAPVDILGNYDSRWVDKVVQIEKWKEKKQLLDEFIKKTKNCQLVPQQSSQYIKLIKRLLNENNINLLQCGFKLLNNLCLGLRKNFIHPAKNLVGLVFTKLRDKKAIIADDAFLCVKNLMFCLKMDDIMENIKEGLDDKAPNMRVQSLKVIELYIGKNQPKVESNMKNLVIKLAKMTQDGTVEVRQTALKILCKLKSYHGMHFFGDKLRDLPSNKIQAIENYKGGKGDNSDSNPLPNPKPNAQIDEQVISEPIKRQSPEKQKLMPKKKPVHTKNQPNQAIQNINKMAAVCVPEQFSALTAPILPSSQPYVNSSKQSLSSNQPYGMNKVKSKCQRLNQEMENPWPIMTSSASILNLFTLLNSLNNPLKELAYPIHLKSEHFVVLRNMTPEFMSQWSDILVKWIFWRLQIQKPYSIAQVLSFAKVLVEAIVLHECEVVILHGALMNCVQENGRQVLQEICSFCNVLSLQWKQKTFCFWLHCLNDPSVPTGDILYILMKCFPDLLHRELVTLARYPAVAKCAEFMDYLQKNYDKKILQVYGFQQRNKYTTDDFKSSRNLIQGIDRNESNFYLELFERSSSDEMIHSLLSYLSELPEERVFETHIRIMGTINVPYLRKEVSFLNVYSFYQFLMKNLTQLNFREHLMTLVRILVYFMVDLDDHKSQSDHKQLISIINKMLLLVMERADSMHILQVLFLMIRDQIKCNDSPKMLQLLPKCLNRVVKAEQFRQTAKENIRYLLAQLNQIITHHDLHQDSILMNSFLNVLRSISQKYHTTLVNQTEYFLKGASGELHPKFRTLVQKIEASLEPLPTMLSHDREQEVQTAKSATKLQYQMDLFNKKPHIQDQNAPQNTIN